MAAADSTTSSNIDIAQNEVSIEDIDSIMGGVPGLKGIQTQGSRISDVNTCDLESLTTRSEAAANNDFNEVTSYSQKNHEFRLKLDHLLHTKKFQILIIVLVLVDALTVIAELVIDLGILEIDDGKSNESSKTKLEHSIWPHIFHTISLIILSFFVIEFILKMYAMGLKLLHHKMEVVDGVIILVSFILDIVTILPCCTGLSAALGLIIVLRLWRILRIVNSIVLSVRIQGQKTIEQQVLHAKKTQAQLDEIQSLSAKLKESLGMAIDRLKTHSIDCSDLEDVLHDSKAHSKESI